MATVKIGWFNSLASNPSGVSVTSSDTNYYKNRLYDFDVGKLWRGGAINQIVGLVQTAVYTIDTLVIPERHNLASQLCTWQYSLDNVTWSNAVAPWYPSSNSIIRKTMTTPQLATYWRLIINHYTYPELSECWMTYLYSFEVQPKYGLTSTDKRRSIKIDSVGGKSTFLKLGRPKRYLEYTIYAYDATDLDLLYWMEAYMWGGGIFFIIDHDGNEFFAELLNELEITTISKNSSKYLYSTNIQLQQVF